MNMTKVNRRLIGLVGMAVGFFSTQIGMSWPMDISLGVITAISFVGIGFIICLLGFIVFFYEV